MKKPSCETQPERQEEVSIDAAEAIDWEADDVGEEKQLRIEVEKLCKRLPLLIPYQELFFPIIGRPLKREIEHNII